VLLLIRGAWLTRPEQSTKEWSRPVGMHALAFDPHGALVVQVDSTLMWYDPTTQDLATSTPMATLQADGDITSFAISTDGQWVATGTTNGMLTLWTGPPNWRAAETLAFAPPAGGERSVTAISFSADGRSACWVAFSHTADWTKTITIRVWDRITRQDRFTFTQTVPGPGFPLTYELARLSPDGQLVVLIGQGLEVHEVATSRLVYRITPDPMMDDRFVGLVISPDQQWVASGGQGQVTIRRFSDGAVMQVLKGPPSEASLLAFSPNSRYLAVAAQRTNYFAGMQPVTLWQVADGRPVQTFQGHIEGARGLDYSHDGQYLATYKGTSDETIRLWRVSPHNPFEPLFWLGGGLALLLATVGRWIWQRRRPRA